MTKKKSVFDEPKNEDFSDRVRFPIVLNVDKIEFEPKMPSRVVVTRSSYDMLLTERDILELHDWLTDRITRKHYTDARIRFVGRIEGE